MPPNQSRWLQWVFITSIPLKRLAPDKTVIDMASGCLVNYKNRSFILTVAHSVRLGLSDWVIELGHHEKNGTEIYWPRHFSYLGGIRKETGEIVSVDYTWAEVPKDLEPTFQPVTPFGPISKKRIRHIFDLDKVALPDANGIYAFSGEIRPEMHSSLGFVTEVASYPGLKYIKTEGPFYQFQLPVDHPGHDAFKGCSGAPIVDTKRRLVALVCGGDTETNVIYGLALSRYKFAIDFYCKTIRLAQ